MHGGFLGGSVVKNPPVIQETNCDEDTWFSPWVKKIPRRRKWKPTPVFLPGKSHRQRNLVGYSLWGRKPVSTQLLNENHCPFKNLPVVPCVFTRWQCCANQSGAGTGQLSGDTCSLRSP